jgi:uncharacterized protein with von Willebrand factor type A (vWA) domain
MYPFWSLYQKLKKEINSSLSIEDYFLLLRSLEQMPDGSVRDYKQFISFCKIFWLKNPKNEFAFETLFKVYKRQMIQELENILNAKIEKTDDTLSQGKSKTDEAVSTDEQLKTKNQEYKNNYDQQEQLSKDKQKLKEEPKEKTAISDLELRIGDADANVKQEELNYVFNHFFFMGDDFIMPFDKRYLAQRMRRMVETKDKVPGDQINIPEILKDFSRDQFISDIHYLDEDFSSTKVVLLVDRMGSMLAYEHIEKHLAETFNIIPGINLEYYFFSNLPPTSKNEEHFMLSSALEINHNINSKDHKWDRNTWFFILSDAGAHSGTVSGGRIKATVKFWKYLKNVSDKVFWLNPVPNEFMNDCTAKRLQMMIPMYGLEEKELRKLFRSA